LKPRRKREEALFLKGAIKGQGSRPIKRRICSTESIQCCAKRGGTHWAKGERRNGEVRGDNARTYSSGFYFQTNRLPVLTSLKKRGRADRQRSRREKQLRGGGWEETQAFRGKIRPGGMAASQSLLNRKREESSKDDSEKQQT